MRIGKHTWRSSAYSEVPHSLQQVSPKGKGLKRDKKEQSTLRPSVKQRKTYPPIDPEHKDIEGNVHATMN